MTPFLTFYTPTFRRPTALAACLASVSAQTARDRIEHLVIPDHVGRGVGGMFTQVPQYAAAVHGRYVHVLADDDVLASPTVVEQVEAFAVGADFPAVILVAAQKGRSIYPSGRPWPPVQGSIDLGCVITRADIWKAHVADYGSRYEGDWDHMDAMYRAGHQAVFCEVLFLRGAVSQGAPEVAA